MMLKVTLQGTPEELVWQEIKNRLKALEANLQSKDTVIKQLKNDVQAIKNSLENKKPT